MRLVALLVLTACTSEPASSGPGVTSHVVSFEFAASEGGACVDSELADVDTTTPGQQYECSVSDIIDFGTANAHEVLLPACNDVVTPASSTNKPCWAIVTDTVKCPAGDHVRIVVERSEAPAASVHVSSQCAAL